jgi:pyruvate dehydrogenase E1 component
VAADAWSATSYQQLRNDALAAERWNRLHPDEPARVPYVMEALAGGPEVVVAATDHVQAVPDQVARWVPGRWTSLGTDGFGRSDSREALRRHFEVDAEHIVVAALAGLAATGRIGRDAVAKAISDLGLDPDAPDPLSV